MAADLPLPTTLLCHSHWLSDGVKMSKALGNVVDPFSAANRFTAEGLRYFLLREGTLNVDSSNEPQAVHYRCSLGSQRSKRDWLIVFAGYKQLDCSTPSQPRSPFHMYIYIYSTII